MCRSCYVSGNIAMQMNLAQSQARQSCGKSLSKLFLLVTQLITKKPMMVCIAAQICDLDETPAGAIWIPGPAKRKPKSNFRELGSRVSTASHRILRRIWETE